MNTLIRSFTLLGQSYRVLMKDKQLMILPLCSGISILAICLSFLVPLQLLSAQGWQESEAVTYGIGILLYIASYTISFFFQAAVVAGATQRMEGGNPTISSALSAAAKRFPVILMWGIISGTIGMVLKTLGDRGGIAGRIVTMIAGVTWSLATFFMVPVLVTENLRVKESFDRSWTLFKKTWGEAVVGSGGMGLAALVLGIPLFLLAFIFAATGFIATAIGITLAGVAFLMTFFSALEGVFITALYRHATGSPGSGDFDSELLASTFRPK